MAAGRRAPDRPDVLERAFRDAIEAGRKWSRAPRLFIGGKSMGGRIATHLGADGVDRLVGIIALGYPLHPPAKPEQLRVAHLPRIAVPLLIVQGERDTFGTPHELQPVIEAMSAPVTVHVVAGGDHSLAVRRGGPPIQEAVLDVVSSWVNSQSVQRQGQVF
jgi:predicted alpha/beta-hydrolase family hydrolase